MALLEGNAHPPLACPSRAAWAARARAAGAPPLARCRPCPRTAAARPRRARGRPRCAAGRSRRTLGARTRNGSRTCRGTSAGRQPRCGPASRRRRGESKHGSCRVSKSESKQKSRKAVCETARSNFGTTESNGEIRSQSVGVPTYNILALDLRDSFPLDDNRMNEYESHSAAQIQQPVCARFRARTWMSPRMGAPEVGTMYCSSAETMAAASARPSSSCGKCTFISSPSKSALYVAQLA